MADGDDDGVLSEEQTESLLTGSESVPGLSFPIASGIEVGSVGKAIVGSIAFAFALALNTLVDAVSTAYAGLIDGFRGFIAGGRRYVSFPFGGGYTTETDGLIDVTIGAGVAAIEGAWSFSVDQFGVFAIFVGIGTVLVTAYVATKGVDVASEVLQ
ncbi:hypothetical protein DJ73_02190 [Halorubrum sp. Ea1]|uniref:hypothetical protein n=1 Tax=Halorubrum sp. Ea1 TaxID=1480718 RepID=UPI000B98CC2B|nr:hypothetical protein [Halorubrum sp. Ea1]OYR55530.1 hypothetical protein DJ73_02190 [Halorubrum sp. Ea1]